MARLEAIVESTTGFWRYARSRLCRIVSLAGYGARLPQLVCPEPATGSGYPSGPGSLGLGVRQEPTPGTRGPI